LLILSGKNPSEKFKSVVLDCLNMNQEQIIQMQVLEQEAEALSQQLQLIEQNLSEINDLGLSLEEIEKKDNKEILVNIGKRIYLPVEIKDNNLFVEIGKGNFIKKTCSETREIIKGQIKKLIIGREEITARLNELQQEANNLMQIYIKESQKDKEEIK
jgi:prefoldin alpha subunit